MPGDGFFHRVRQALSLGTDEALGDMLGVSKRTAQRYSGGRVPRNFKRELARIVLPFDPQIAADIAASEEHTLQSWNLVAPEPQIVVREVPVLPPAPPPPPPDDVIDSVVCAAAEAMEMMPRDIRGGLLAAFRRARRIGVTVEHVERVLDEALAPGGVVSDAPKGAPKTAKSGAGST